MFKMFDFENIHFEPKYKAIILTTCVKEGIFGGIMWRSYY
jgi:hypothetical protein